MTRSVMSALALLMAFALAPVAITAKDPEVTVTRIENMPNKLFYFDDTQVSNLSIMSVMVPVVTRLTSRSFSFTTLSRCR